MGENDVPSANRHRSSGEERRRVRIPGTKYTTDTMLWTWCDGAHPRGRDPSLPEGVEAPSQGSLFIGEEGMMLLPHVRKADCSRKRSSAITYGRKSRMATTIISGSIGAAVRPPIDAAVSATVLVDDDAAQR